MKKISIFILLLLLLTINAISQSTDAGVVVSQLTPEQNSAMTEIGKLNIQVIDLFKEKKLDDALRLALNIQSIIEKNALTENPNTVRATTNLAEIYLAKGDESKAIMVFQKALDMYAKNYGEESAPVAKVTDRIAFSYFIKEDYPKSEEYYLKLAALRQKINGPESRETAATYTNLANVYRKDGKWSLADGAYLEAIAINDKALTKEEKTKRTDTENYHCFLYHWGANINSLNAMIVRAGEFDRARAYAERPMSGKPDIPNTGVINGKAIHLEKPEYPASAMHAPGFVFVQVTIDEDGNVSDARSTCGIKEFLKASEGAALRSKFSPTLLKGKPVKVSGVIVYIFGGK